MSSFTTPANLEMLPDMKWKVITPFEYHVGNLPSLDIIIVPSGFVTDLTSIPRMFWSIMPPHGEYAKAAILHDYLYDNAIGSKKYADDIFFEALGVLGVCAWRKYIMYWAVKYFGKGNYK
jgi:hypothetical protein